MTYLRPWTAADSARVWELAQADPGLRRQLPDGLDSQGAESWCAQAQDRDGVWRYAMVVASDVGSDTVVGNVGLMVRREPRVAWMSYWLAREARGRGLATRALVTLCEVAWDELDMHRLELGYRLNNPESGAVARRAGFVREGVLREELQYDGIRYDTAIESRLPSDPTPDVSPLPVRAVAETPPLPRQGSA